MVENAGRLIEKDELMERIWHERFVEESNLTFNIKMLRRALGDDAAKPLFIETVPKRGYRFIAEVRRVKAAEEETEKNTGLSTDSSDTFSLISPSHKGAVVALADWQHKADENKPEEGEVETQSDLVPARTDASAPIKKRAASSFLSRKTLAAFALAALLVGSIGIGYYFFSAGKTAVGAKKTIAVLPSKPINTMNRDEIYEVGIADSLIHQLSSMKGFIVRPLSATRQYADIAQDPIAAGREQQVDYVLASNYQLAGGKIKVTSQLFNVANGQIEETYKSEKDAGDVFAMQDAIAGEVGNILLARFAITSSSPTAKRGTINEEAYRLYLQGMYLYDKRTPEDSQKAVEFFEQAVKLDPNYARAWAGKAHAHRSIANLRRNTNIQEEYQKSIEAINKALALDANLSEAYSALCENKMYYEYDFAGAESACQRAVELDPNSPLAHEIYSRYLNSRGRFDNAIAEVKTAIDLEPASLFNQQSLGSAFYQARRFEEAVVQFKRVIAMDDNFGITYQWLSNTLGMQGKDSEAFEVWMKFLALQKADEETVRAYQTAFQTSGWQGVLRERANRFEKGNEAYSPGARFNAQIGNKDKAFEYLEKSFQRREWGMAYLQVDPRLDPLRDDPRFAELVRRVGLK
jgi:DNA-binding winged helix-turn-helix (wHTH) protein/TolB-like protein/Tfp pilus assembly protein PilF